MSVDRTIQVQRRLKIITIEVVDIAPHILLPKSVLLEVADFWSNVHIITQTCVK